MAAWVIALPCTLYVDDDDDDDRNSTFLPLLAAVVTLAMQNVFMSQRNEKYQASSVNHRHHSKMCSAGSGRILASPRPRRTAEERKRKEMKHRARWRRFEVNHKGGGRGTEGGERGGGVMWLHRLRTHACMRKLWSTARAT